MELIINVNLYKNPFTFCLITEDCFFLPEEKHYSAIGVKIADCCVIKIHVTRTAKTLIYRAPAYFLQPFVKECISSKVYRINLLTYLNQLSCNLGHEVTYLKLILKPADKDILDYAWNEKLLRLVWTRVEIENAFSWLSTLGGAYSALGDYFDYCAEEAGRISVRQYRLSKMLGDDSLAARSKLYTALSCSQKGKLKLARHIVRSVAAFGIQTCDKRLVRMCHGVWAKLKYLRVLRNNAITNNLHYSVNK